MKRTFVAGLMEVRYATILPPIIWRGGYRETALWKEGDVSPLVFALLDECQ